MVDTGYIIIIVSFLIYYFLILIQERKILEDPRVILEKFLSMVLLYAGISLIYYSITRKPFFGDNIDSYFIYIFIIGFIAVLWTVPNLLSEFDFFNRFVERGKVPKKKRRAKK